MREARVLLGAKHWSGAYYVAGYAAECALKACIAKKTMRGDFPDLPLAKQVFTHDLTKLVRAAGLDSELQHRETATRAFEINWAIVKDWGVEARYAMAQESEARDLLSALNARKEGVLPWIRQHW